MKIKEGGVMDLQKEREAFQKFCEENFDFERHEQTYFDEQTQCYENDIGEDTESINMAWSAWQAQAQAVPKDSVVVSKWTLALALNSIENNEDNEGIIEDLQELIHKAQEPQITELKVEWASDCFKCGHHEAIIYSTAAEASTKGWFHDGDEVKCTGCGNTGEMDARGEDSDICWNENEAND